jgi:hypothetical protein
MDFWTGTAAFESRLEVPFHTVLVLNEWFAANQPPLAGGNEPVAQLVEQRPFKAWVVRSNRTGLTISLTLSMRRGCWP